MLSLFQQFSIILGGQENFIRQGASSLIVAEMCGNINTNESASSNAGRMGLMLIQPQLLSSIQRSFFLPCSAATATPSRSSFRRRRAISGSRWSCNGYRCALRSSDRRAMYCDYSLNGCQSAKPMLVLFNSQLLIQGITGSCKLYLLLSSFQFAQVTVHYLPFSDEPKETIQTQSGGSASLLPMKCSVP